MLLHSADYKASIMTNKSDANYGWNSTYLLDSVLIHIPSSCVSFRPDINLYVIQANQYQSSLQQALVLGAKYKELHYVSCSFKLSFLFTCDTNILIIDS